jgi:hypothetical protein
VRIVPGDPVSKLERLEPRDYLVDDPEAIVHMDWSGEWRP